MGPKPTYEELERKVAELQKEVVSLAKVERTLRKREKKFRMLYENAPLGYQSLNEKGAFLEVNKAWLDTFGYCREEVIGKPFSNFIHPEDREIIARAFRNAVKNGEPYDLEAGLVSAEGRHIWVRTTAKPILEDGKVKKIVGNVVNITDRKRTEEMLLAERLKLERYFENIPLMAFSFSFNGRIADCNTNALNALGYKKKDDLLGKPAISTLYAPGSQKKAKRIFEMWKKGQKIKNKELEVITSRGEIIDVLLNVDRVFDQDGSPIHSIATHLDITERKRAHEKIERLGAQLYQARKVEAVATLAGGIAHDYNNLLSVIMGNLSLAMEKAGLEPELAEFLEEANRASLKVRDLTQELMALSGGGAPVKKVGSLEELLRGALESIPDNSGISLKTSIATDLWRLPFDPLKMGTAFRNVVTNAVEAMPNGGTITIRAENVQTPGSRWNPKSNLTSDDYVRISFQDEGTGIHRKHLSKIFDPYFSTKPLGVQKGMGLGLATTYAIVEKHGGQILVDSWPGKGTTVNIYLPVKPDAGKRNGRYVAGQPAQPSIQRVLVMDDEEMLRKLAQQMLKRLGYEVKTVKDGFEAIEAVRTQKDSGNPFDMVIVDLTIKGGMGGEQTIQELLKIDPHIKTIVSSGYVNDPIMDNYEAYGFMGSMAKPYEIHNLKEAIEKLPS